MAVGVPLLALLLCASACSADKGSRAADQLGAGHGGGSSVGARGDAGSQTDARSQTDAGDQTDAGSQIDARSQTDAGGQIDAGGRTDAGTALVPAWAAGKPLNEWFQIPGTSGAGGTAVYAYCGMALRPSTSEIIVALAGGHGDSADNRVASIRLDQDQPAWTVRMPPSTEVQPNVAYYADGKPAARHTYYTTHYVEQVDRLMVIGAQFVYGSAVTFLTVDGFDLNTNTWDPAGTWSDLVGGYGKALDSATGDVWTAHGYSISKWSAATRKQTVLQQFNSTYMAMQNAWDPVRNQLVSIGFGDGWGYGNFPTLNAYKIDADGTTATALTFKPSPGLTQFLADRPVSASFEYDPDHDRFLYFDGLHDGDHGPLDDGGRIFIIKPNAGSTWDISIMALGPSTQNPPLSGSSGIFSRFRYVPALKGFVFLYAPSWDVATDLYFIKTAP